MSECARVRVCTCKIHQEEPDTLTSGQPRCVGKTRRKSLRDQHQKTIDSEWGGRIPVQSCTAMRTNSESDACLLHLSYCKTQGADFSLWRRELKDFGDVWSRPTTEFHEACCKLKWDIHRCAQMCQRNGRKVLLTVMSKLASVRECTTAITVYSRVCFDAILHRVHRHRSLP